LAVAFLWFGLIIWDKVFDFFEPDMINSQLTEVLYGKINKHKRQGLLRQGKATAGRRTQIM